MFGLFFDGRIVFFFALKVKIIACHDDVWLQGIHRYAKKELRKKNLEITDLT